MKKTLFLVFSAAILVFSIISLCTAPVINKVITESSTWKNDNCKKYADDYKETKDGPDYNGKDDYLKKIKKDTNKCNRKKAMYGLEYSALIIDLFLGFVCAILALLHFFDQAKYFEKITGIIGLATGIIGFILTLVYVCYSGYIFTKDPALDSNLNSILKLNGEGAFAEWDSNKGQYKCLYYKEKDENSHLAKYSDLGKKQYNYQKKRSYGDDRSKNSCSLSAIILSSYSSPCSSEYISGSGLHSTYSCDYLYSNEITNYDNKYVFDRWVTTIIFSCFIIACDIGLAIFGFLLCKNSNGSGI